VRKRKKSRKHTSAFPSGLFLDKYPLNTRFSEAYRTLRTNLDFSFMEKACRSLLVTSAGAEEGKTITVANLAYTISRTGRSVLMVDADLRRPRLSRLNASQESSGLTGLLSDVFSTDLKSGPLGQFGMSDLYRLLSFKKRRVSYTCPTEKMKWSFSFYKGNLWI